MPPNRRYDHDPDLGWDTDQHHYYPKESYFQYDHEHARSVYPREYLDNPHYYDRATTVYPPDYTKPHQMNKTAPGQKKDKQSKKHKPKKTKSEKDAKDQERKDHEAEVKTEEEHKKLEEERIHR